MVLDSNATRRTRAIGALFFFVLCGGLVGQTVSLLQHMTVVLLTNLPCWESGAVDIVGFDSSKSITMLSDLFVADPRYGIG